MPQKLIPIIKAPTPKAPNAEVQAPRSLGPRGPGGRPAAATQRGGLGFRVFNFYGFWWVLSSFLFFWSVHTGSMC